MYMRLVILLALFNRQLMLLFTYRFFQWPFWRSGGWLWTLLAGQEHADVQRKLNQESADLVTRSSLPDCFWSC